MSVFFEFGWSSSTIGDAVAGDTTDRLLERLQNVARQVCAIFNAAADADQVVKDAGGLPLLLGNTHVGHARRHLDQTLDAAKRLGQGEDFGVRAEALGGLLAALDAEGEHTTTHAVAVLLERDGVLRMRGQAGVVDGDDVGRCLERVCDGRGVGGRLPRAQVQRLETAVRQPAVECAGNGSNRILQKREALIQRIRVERGDAHQDVRVSVDVLGHAVHHNVGAVVERVLHVWRQERVVHNHQNSMSVCNSRYGANIHQAQRGVAGRLDPYQLGLVGANQVLNVKLDGGRKGDVYAVRGSDLGEVAVGSSVYV